jgi:hypothetical protein
MPCLSHQIDGSFKGRSGNGPDAQLDLSQSRVNRGLKEHLIRRCRRDIVQQFQTLRDDFRLILVDEFLHTSAFGRMMKMAKSQARKAASIAVRVLA